MGLKRMKSRLFQKTMLSYTGILMIPIAIFCVLFYRQIAAEETRLIQNSYQDSVSNITSIVDRKFFDITTLGDRLLTSNWVKRIRSSSPIITSYFDQTKMGDICQELLGYAASLGITDDIMVLLPSKGEGVSTSGWGSLTDILNCAGINTREGQEALLAQISLAGHFQLQNADHIGIIPGREKLFMLQSLDVSGNLKAVLLIGVEDVSFQSYLEKLNVPDLLALSIMRGGEEVYRYRVQEEARYAGAQSVTVHSALFDWDYQILLEKIPVSSFFTRFSMVFLALVISTALGVLAAYALSLLSYRPIQALVGRIGGDRKEPEYQAISDTFDRLTAEKEELGAMVKQYEDSARNNLLVNLLQGYFADEQIATQLDAFHLSYNNSYSYVVLVFSCPQVHGEGCFPLFLNIKAGLMAEKLSFELLECPDETIVSILCFPDAGQGAGVKALGSKLVQHVREKIGANLNVSFGTLEKGLVGISKSYQAAKEQNANLAFLAGRGTPIRIRCYYPTDWEIQLVNNLKLGNEEPAVNILKELKKENDGRPLPSAQQMKVVSMIFDTILRVMDELEMDTSEAAFVFEETFGQISKKKQWEYLEGLTRELCGRASYSSHSQTEDNGRKLLNFVEANYENSSLSLKELGDQLGLSTSAVSRSFKASVKINFYDYLCRVRMEKAKEYLRGTGEPISEVAKKVGYENELSFKRAFLRYEGIKPREYRMQSRPDTDTQRL